MEENTPESAPKRTIHSAQREVTPAFTLNQVGKLAINRARADGRGQFLDVLTAQLMCALTVEAVLNHVGKKLFVEDTDEPQIWAAVERRSPRDKLSAVAERAGMELDWGAKPFQDFGPIFKFRDDLAHAKSLLLHTNNIPPGAIDNEGSLREDNVPGLRARWERDCDIETAERWRKSMYEMTDALCSAADCISPVRAGFHSEWSASVS